MPEQELLNKTLHTRRLKRMHRKKWLSLAILVALALLVFLTWGYYSAVESRVLKQDIYRFQLDFRQSFSGVTKISRKDGETRLKNGDERLLLGSEPFYFAGEARVLLPQNMVGCLTREPLFGRINYFTELTAVDGRYYAQNGAQTRELAQAFLFDGADLYLFLEPVTLYTPEKEVALPPLSYVIVRYNQSVEYYDQQKDLCTVEVTGPCQVLAEGQSGWRLNLSTDILIKEENNQILLFRKPELLPDLLSNEQ